MGAKWSVCISQMLHIPYLVAQLMPTPLWLYSTGVLFGFADAIMLCAEALYLIALAQQYVMATMPVRRRTSIMITASKTDFMIVRFFGLYAAVTYGAYLLGGLCMTLLLGRNYSPKNTSDERNWHPSDNVTVLQAMCGANFCPTRNFTLLMNSGLGAEPYAVAHMDKMLALVITYSLAIVAGSAVFAAGMDDLDRFLDAKPSFSSGDESDDDQPTGCCEKCMALLASRKIFTDKQLLLVPITIFVGLAISFMAADFTQVLTGQRGARRR